MKVWVDESELRELTALTEDTGLVLSTPMAAQATSTHPQHASSLCLPNAHRARHCGALYTWTDKDQVNTETSCM